MRFDVNVSVRPAGSDELRTRTELKNMNSFNFAAKGIEREIARQIQIYEGGGEVQQETLHFDPTARGLAAAPLQGGGRGLPLLPRARPRAGAAAGGARRGAARRGRRAAGRADPPHRRDALVLRRRRARHGRPRPPLVGGRRRGRRPEGDGERARERVRRRRASTPSASSAAELAKLVVGPRRDPARGVRRGARARRATTSSAPSRTWRRRRSATSASSTRSSTAVIAANPGPVEQYRGGKQGLLGFFVGQVMKETGGTADPRVVSERLREKLGG